MINSNNTFFPLQLINSKSTLTYAQILLRIQLVSRPRAVVMPVVGPRRGVRSLRERRQQRHGRLRHCHVPPRVVPGGGGGPPDQGKSEEVRESLACHAA